MTDRQAVPQRAARTGGHNHGHPHNHETHDLRLAFALNLVFTLIEIVGGLYTNSVAILSDALHDFGDSISLGIAGFLSSYAARGRDRTYSCGYRRFSQLSAAVSGFVLVVGSLYILSEAIPRLISPERSNAQGMILIALVGIAANGVGALRLRGGATFNVQTVAWHLMEGVLGWAAVLVVGIVLSVTDIHILDPILSILITGYVLFNVIPKLRRTLSVFLQSVPEHVDMDAIVLAIEEVDRVSTHHVHIWSLDGARHVLTAHVVVGEGGRNGRCDLHQKRRSRPGGPDESGIHDHGGRVAERGLPGTGRMTTGSLRIGHQS